MHFEILFKSFLCEGGKLLQTIWILLMVSFYFTVCVRPIGMKIFEIKSKINSSSSE